ncbi:MAG: hypothetical protein FWC13_09695 [Oscillospiraceae bacterium]|nr:hypothetical protein [Oscillospiraceae bacterium]
MINEVLKIEDEREKTNGVGTFEISVKFMQNATWQGQIHWIERNQKQHFRSALEMLKLMDEALTESQQDKKAINW